MSVLPRGVTRHITRLNALSTGPGAIRLPADVLRLELRLNRFVGEHNIGAKQFWRNDLPPIQFYNPQLPISVRRFEPENARKSELIVEFSDGSSKVVAAENKQPSQILKELVEATGAFQIEADEQVKL